MTIVFQNLQITRSNIRPHIKLAVSLVMVTLIILRLCGYVWVNIFTLSPQEIMEKEEEEKEKGQQQHVY